MNTNEQPYAELIGAIGKEETETEFHQQIEAMNTPNEQPQGVTPGEVARNAYHNESPPCHWHELSFPHMMAWHKTAQAAIDAYLAALPTNGPSDEEIQKATYGRSDINAGQLPARLRALFAAHHAKELEALKGELADAKEHALNSCNRSTYFQSLNSRLQNLVDATKADYDAEVEKVEALKARVAEL